MEKIYGMHKVVGLQLFWSGTPTFSSGTPTFCQMGVLNSCFQNPSESSDVIDVLTQNNYPGQASVMVARQLKIVSQSDAFMISASRNLQFIFKKLVGLIVFEKDIFDIYLNKMCHIVFSSYLV